MSYQPLRKAVGGDLAGWTGVPDGADRAWVEAQLGPLDHHDAWRGGRAGPEGVIVTFDAGGTIDRIDLPQPYLELDDLDKDGRLGDPEVELATPWARAGSQRAWPSRGLAIHDDVVTVMRIVLFPPATTDSYEASALATLGRPPGRRPRPDRPA